MLNTEGIRERPFIIAELGINHNGDLSIANRLIDTAHQAGCDAVKFQKRTIDIVYSREYLDSPRESPWGSTQRDQKEALEFGRAEYDAIDAYCKQLGIHWFASAWDVPSQEFLRSYDTPYNKIPSPMLTHLELLETVARERKHTFVSCGMSDWSMVDPAVDIFRGQGCPFTLMHSISVYPAEDEECNVSCIEAMRERYGCDVGYSGHEKGVLPSILAVAWGATVLERHITLDRTMYGTDQAASLERRGLELLVRDARRVARIVGNGQRTIGERELAIARKLRYHEAMRPVD